MATSEVHICRLALLKIGITQLPTSLTETSKAAIACNELYAQTRDALLADFPWPFATRRAVLAALTGVTRTNWAYAYNLPNDCIAMRKILIDGNPTPTAAERVPHSIETNDAGDGSILLTNQPAAEISYTRRMTNVQNFPPLFANALVWRMASELAMPMAVKRDIAMDALKGYELALADAGAAALNEEQPDVDPDCEFLTSRS